MQMFTLEAFHVIHHCPAPQVFGQTLIVPPLPSSAATIILALHILEGQLACTIADMRHCSCITNLVPCFCRGLHVKGSASLPSACAGYVAPLGGPISLGSHHVAEAMKHAFALRMQLGDPEPGTESTALMDALSPSFAAELR